MGFLSPIRRQRDGRYRLRLDPAVRGLLKSVPAQLLPILGSDDPMMRRLYPPAYVGQDNAKAEADYRQMVGGVLENHHRQALETLVKTADAETLSVEELNGWLAAVGTIRLVLGTRLDVSEDMAEPEGDDPRLPEFALYQLLSVIQEAIIEVLAADLPDEGAPEGQL
ncbi:MAG TPA: DUF2017 family protein [Acidimicrobiales bacterium]|nr:DUF2017 family protein [Acidimicrobiales bacterium]